MARLILLAVWLGSAIAARTVQAQTFSCINNQDARTAALRSPSGTTVVLTMHSEDDHGRNTHLCEADYALEITGSDGSKPASAQILSSDGTWNRMLSFRVDGFSEDGSRAFLFIAEGKYSKMEITVEDYDLAAGTSRAAFLKPPQGLKWACAATLHVAGITPAGGIVVASVMKDGCSREQQWIARADKDEARSIARYPEPLATKTHMMPLSSGTRF